MVDQVRVCTVGSVDDGKSTLIGRLLHDTKTIFEDQLAAVAKASRRYGDGEVNLALLTDGLRAEREQGITIDVAFRFFATPRRSFVLADTPGHEQYTRNMVSGSSVSDIAIVLVDARHGVVDQTRRHLAIAELLAVRHLVLAVNKMDLVGWSQERFDEIVLDVQSLVSTPLHPVPVCALTGANVATPSRDAPWYVGPSILDLLESLDVVGTVDIGARLPVQWVIRAPDHRSYAGQLHGGGLGPGDRVIVLPAGHVTTVDTITRVGELVDLAGPGDAVAVTLAGHFDVGRGDVVAAFDRPPAIVSAAELDVCWLADEPLRSGGTYLLKHLTRTVTAVLDGHLRTNEIGRISARLSTPLVADPYECHRCGLIVIDERTNATAGAAMIRNLMACDR